jgi:two-component system LytT family sensor kinase
VNTANPEPPTTVAARRSPDRLRLLGFGLVIGFFVVDGLFRTAYFYFGALADGARHASFLSPLIAEMSGSVAVAILFFTIILPAARRFPLRGPHWRRFILPHVAGLLVYSALKTLIMWGLRIPLWPLAGLGRYDYGLVLYRFPMEGAKDVLSYALMVGAIHFWDGWKARQERQLREARLEAALHEARLQALQGQLQPHFLFNTLNTISSVMYADPALADRLIARLSDLLRSSLAAPSRPEVGLEEELEILDRYVELMSARFGDRLTVSVSVAQEARGCAVPIFLLQPILENSIQHGIARRAGPGTVRVAVSRVGDRLLVSLTDDGPGIDGDPNEAVGRGVGLRNTQERLRHLYGDEGMLTLSNGSAKGLTVTVQIPFRSLDEVRGEAHA